MDAISKLTDVSLIQRLEALSQKEIKTTVELLLHLAEVDRRKLYLEAGHSSLFNYCTKGKLRYSEPAAHRRITAARLIAQFPHLAMELMTKEVSLSTLSLIAGILKPENSEDVFKNIRGKSRREVESFVAGYRPRTEVPRERIKPIVVKKSGQPPDEDLFSQTRRKNTEQNHTFAGESGRGSPSLQRVTTIAEQRYKLEFSVSAAVMQKLEEAQCCLSGKYPTGVNVEQVFEEALELLLEKRSPKRRQERRAKRQARKNQERSERPRAGLAITQEVRDQVFERDQGRCTFVGSDGKRCGARVDLEVHHKQPLAKGGENTLDNLTLTCRVHNIHEALRDYGSEHMQRYLGEGWVVAASRFRVKEMVPNYGRPS